MVFVLPQFIFFLLRQKENEPKEKAAFGLANSELLAL